MNKKLILMVTFLIGYIFITQYCSAQSNLSLGIKAGIDIPNLKASGNDPVSKGWSSRLGPYAGIIAELQLNHRFSLQSELNYSSQGGKKNGTQAISSSQLAKYFGIPLPSNAPSYVYISCKSEVKLNYIELPILLKVNFSLGKIVAFFGDVGFYAGYLINAKNVTKGSSKIYFDENLTQPLPETPEAVLFNINMNLKDDLKKFNFGIQGGLGLSLSLSDRSRLLLMAGGNYGLVHIQKDKANGSNNTGAATITLGYIISL
jgi:hypothetical protein